MTSLPHTNLTCLFWNILWLLSATCCPNYSDIQSDRGIKICWHFSETKYSVYFFKKIFPNVSQVASHDHERLDDPPTCGSSTVSDNVKSHVTMRCCLVSTVGTHIPSIVSNIQSVCVWESVWERESLCVRESEREWERKCVRVCESVCICERETKSVHVSERVWESVRKCVRDSVCGRERETVSVREWEIKCVRERESVRDKVCESVRESER